jgi:Ca2+-binding RTX toxin-like protein
MDAAGDPGNDTLVGGSGGDVLVGGDDRGLTRAKNGRDTLDGGSATTPWRAAGADFVNGGEGADTATTRKGDAVVGVERDVRAMARRRFL